MRTLTSSSNGGKCYNSSFGLTTKAKAYKGTGQEWSLGVTFHAPENVGKCEGMNPHTPMWASTLKIRAPMDSRIFKRRLQESNPLDLRVFYTIGKILDFRC
jgi:hypothetical protein